jgi:hypothetical protein
MAALPLLVFDTNIVMDVLLDRDRNEAILLVELAEAKRVDLAMPEYVLMEFRGTALRWIRDEIERLRSVRRSANEWARSRELDKPADVIRTATAEVHGDHVGGEPRDLGERVVAVLGLADDLERAAGQRPRDRGAHEQRVVDDQHADPAQRWVRAGHASSPRASASASASTT